MNKVTTINLNGRAYQIEEKGYDILREYLEKAEAKLHDNPDKDELMADFEQAIADKCDARLSPRKNVVTASEVEEIINAMGPVDASGGSASAGEKNDNEQGAAGTSTSGSSSSAAWSAASPKRLYQIRQGAWITGVCNGLAAYFGLDVTVVRVLFVLLGVLTHGFWIAAYVILMIIMPTARTEEEFAAARGAKPFNAHDFIQQAKARAEEFRKEFGDHTVPPQPAKPGFDGDRAAWQKWKEDMKAWKRQWKEDIRRAHDAHRAAQREARHGWQNHPWQNRAWQDDYATSAGSGFFRFLMGLVLTALFLLWAFSIWTVIKHGTIFGIALVAGHPLWIPIAFICALFYVVAVPFKLLMRNARPQHWSHYSFFNDVMQSIFFIFGIYLVILLGSQLFPIVGETLYTAFAYVVRTVRNL